MALTDDTGGLCVVLAGPPSAHDCFSDHGDTLTFWTRESLPRSGGDVGRLTIEELAHVLAYIIAQKGIPSGGHLDRLLQALRFAEREVSSGKDVVRYAVPWEWWIEPRSKEMAPFVW